MGFIKVSNVGGSYEKTIFASALNQKSNQLSYMYDELLVAIKMYEIREGYTEVDEHKEKLLKVKKEIEALSSEINNTVNRLRG